MLLLFIVFFLPGFLWPQAPERLGLYMTQSILIAAPQVLLLLYLLWLRRGRSPEQTAGEVFREYGVGAPRASDLVHALAIFAGLVALLALATWGLARIPALGREILGRGFRYRLPRPALLPLAALFALATAYREELFFRCYLITRLQQLTLPAWAAAGASTALFAVGHLYQGPAGLIVAALLGTCFALLFLRLRNLHRLALAHALYNLAVLAATLFSAAGAAAGPPFTIARILAIVGVL